MFDQICDDYSVSSLIFSAGMVTVKYYNYLLLQFLHHLSFLNMFLYYSCCDSIFNPLPTIIEISSNETEVTRATYQKEIRSNGAIVRNCYGSRFQN